MAFIKKELSDTELSLLHNDDFSFEENDELMVKKDESSFDNIFKRENSSVDMLLKEINVDQTLAQQQFSHHISPTKPLNLKNSSKINLHDDEFDSSKIDEVFGNQETGVMQTIPLNPNTIPPTKSYSQLNGPRAIYLTPKKTNIHNNTNDEGSPSRKSVLISSGSPQVIKYEMDTSESEEEEEELEENIGQNGILKQEVKQIWKPLSPKRRKPLPDLQPASADSSIMPNSPILHKLAQFDEAETAAAQTIAQLTTEELISLKQMTMEEKLNAALDSGRSGIVPDHEKYLEDLKFKRTPSVIKKNNYYDDLLINSAKVKDQTEEEEYDGFAELYESNIRNTKSYNSLKLDLNRSNSVQSQISIASGERILNTKPINKEVPSIVPIREGANGLFDDLDNSYDKPNQSENDEMNSITQQQQQEFGISKFAEDEEELNQATHTPLTPVKISHSRQSSLTDALSPYKMSQFLINVGSNLKRIVSSNELANQSVETIDVFNNSPSKLIKLEEHNLDSDEEGDQVLKKETENDGDDELHLKREPITEIETKREPVAELELLTKKQSNLTNTTTTASSNDESADEDSLQLKQDEREIKMDIVGNSTEIADEVNLEDKTKATKYRIESNSEYDNSSNSLSLDLSQQSNVQLPIKQEHDQHQEVKPKQEFQEYISDSYADILVRKSSYSNGSSSPRSDIYSIWQSQPEFLRVPKHKTTRCSSVISSGSNPKAHLNFKQEESKGKNSVHLISKRVISTEYDEKDNESKLINDTSEIFLPNLSGDSDFGSDFKKYGIKIDADDLNEEDEGEEEEEDDEFHDSRDLLSSPALSIDQKNVRNIWRNGTIRGHVDKSLVNPINIYSDEDHQVKNVLSTATINLPVEILGQHVASLETATLFPDDEQEQKDDDEENNSVETEIRTIENNDVTMLKNISSLDSPMELKLAHLLPNEQKPLPPNPLRIMSQTKMNTLQQEYQKVVQPSVKTLVNGESGRMFLKLKGLTDLELPNFRNRKAKFYIILDNGIHRIQTDYFKLDERIPIDREFEFVCQESLSLVLTLKAKYEKFTDELVEVKEREVIKSKSFFGKLLKNKHVVTRTKFVTKPAPHDPWSDLMAKDGSFGKVLIDLSKFEKEITGKAVSYKLSIINEWNAKKYNQFSKIGSLNLELLFLPRVSKYEILPTSIKQAYDELTLVRSQQTVKYEGFLNQEGGDCSSMKRRFFKLEDTTLTAFNEDSLKTRCKINLKKVVDLIYITTDSKEIKKGDRNFSDNLMKFGFKLRFANGEIIEFNAQDQTEKDGWIEILQQVINGNHFARQPWIKLMNQRLIE